MDLIEKIKERARKDLRTLVLPEAQDERVLLAAERIVREGFAREVVLLGGKGIRISGVKTIDPGGKDPISFGAHMVKAGDADAMVAGSASTSADVIRAAIQIIGRRSRDSVVSGCFIIILPVPSYGENGIMAFADAAVIPEPNARQVADIAVATARTFRFLTGYEPRVAMLSFSTKGSARHSTADKMIEATRLVKDRNPELLIDGELQADTALVPFVARRKAPASTVAGNANVLIFPNLNSANIGYKLVERLAGARAYGPFLQGLNKSVSDLSRGCSVDDIVNTSAVALVRAGEQCIY